jgi:hypothetical protein
MAEQEVTNPALASLLADAALHMELAAEHLADAAHYWSEAANHPEAIDPNRLRHLHKMAHTSSVIIRSER